MNVPDARPFEVPEELVPPFQRVLGMKLAAGPDGEGIAWIDVDVATHYGRTGVHGGVFPALVDVAGAVAVAQVVPDAVNAIDGTIEMKLNYLRRVKDGDLTAVAKVIHRGARTAVTEVDLTSRGQLCGKALVSYMLRGTDPT